MNYRRKKWIRTIPLLYLALAALFCSKDYNPFTDLTNAKVHVLSWGFDGKDTVPLYKTGMLKVVVAVREQVDSFMVSAKGNRFWHDTIVRIAAGGPAEAAGYSFGISFYDTGLQRVSVKSFRANGEVISQEDSVRVVNPLHQGDIAGELGRPLTLSTPPVIDKDVRYHWDFGDGRTIISSSGSAAVTLYDGSQNGMGTLQVTDIAGFDSSPSIRFSYVLLDTFPPVILCVNNDGLSDTIRTADSILAFKASIIDNGAAAADTCSVNASPFDLVNAKTHTYTKLFANMPRFTSATGPFAITVWARDHAQNTARRTFYALFDPSGSRDSSRVVFAYPSGDTGRTRTADFWIYGDAENFSGGQLELRLRVNGVQYPSTCPIAGSSGTWKWHLHLDTLINIVEVSAFNTANQKIASSGRVVIYDPNGADDIKPMIWEISAQGRSVGSRLYTEQALVDLQIIAFDEGSGVDSLWVNNQLIAPDSLNGYLWHARIGPLTHQAQGNGVTVRVIDRFRNEKDSTITIFRNTPPVLVADPAIPPVLCTDSSYTIKLAYFDADQDSVKILLDSASAKMASVHNGAITLNPPAADSVGNDSLTIRLSDGYEVSAPYRYNLAIVNCSRQPTPVHFLTRENAFPAFLQAGVDTLRVRLRVDAAPSPSGLRYSARFADRAGATPLLDHDTSATLVWAPGEADTGYCRLSVKVGSGVTDYDSIAPVLAVVPKNQFPCSLSYQFSGDSSFDVFAPETLSFTIHDNDDPRVERYTVSVTQHNVNTVTELNKREFFVAIKPDSLRSLDTLRVSVRDLTGTADSASFTINYAPSSDRFRNWVFKKSVYLNTSAAGGNTAANVYDFPVLVRLTASTFTFSQARANGEDVRFAKADGTPLPFEIERFDPVNDLAEFWVKVDTVYGNDHAHFFVMYWGNASAPALSNGQAVFDTANGFVGVWHLKEGGTATRYNSAQSSFNATPHFYGNNESKASIIALGDSIAARDHLDVGKIELSHALTLSAWVKPAAYSAYGSIIAKEWSPAIGPWQAYGLMMDNQNPAHCQFTLAINSVQTGIITASAIPLNQWTYLSGTWDGSTENVYVNGSSQAQKTKSTGTIQAMPTTLTTIGMNDSLPAEHFNGVLDEIRIERIGRSADWMRLCYMNQKSVDALVTFTKP